MPVDQLPTFVNKTLDQSQYSPSPSNLTNFIRRFSSMFENNHSLISADKKIIQSCVIDLLLMNFLIIRMKCSKKRHILGFSFTVLYMLSCSLSVVLWMCECVLLMSWTFFACYLITVTSVDTQQWAQPVTAGVHGVSSKKCRLEVVE